MAKIVATPRSFSRCQAARELLELAGHEVIIENRGRPLTAPELIEVLKSKNLIQKALSKKQFSTEIYRKGDFISTEIYENSPIIVQTFFNTAKGYDKRYVLHIESKENFSFFWSLININFFKVVLVKKVKGVYQVIQGP